MTVAEAATVPQINVIKALTRQIWDVDWLILEEYGDGEGALDRELARRLITALEKVKTLSLGELDDHQKLDRLASVMAGEQLGDIDGEISTTDVTEHSPEPERSSIDEYREQHMATKVPRFNGRHGTLTARKHHQALGEELCDKCQKFGPRQITKTDEPIAHPGFVSDLIGAEIPDDEEDTEEAEEEQISSSLNPIKHGTPNGHNAHKRRGEEPCDACVEAKRAKNREYYQSKRGRTPATITKATNKRSEPPSRRTRQPAVAKSVANDVLPSGEWISDWPNRLLELTRTTLDESLPRTVDEPFPAEQQEEWLRIARSMFALLWPEKV